MKIFDFMQKGWLKRKRSNGKDTMLVPVDDSIQSLQAGQEGRLIENLVDIRLVTLREPYSLSAEQYRILCTRILQLVQDRSSYTLAISSAIKAEGKSFTSVNLAIAMAKDFDEKVLLIEGDLKNPNLHEYINRSPGFGLSDVLEGRINFDTASIHLFDGRLSVLLAGKAMGNPSRLLSSSKMQELLHALRGQFKYIIIDTPPIIPMVDMNIYSALVDGILLVIRAGKTPRSIIKKALSGIPSEKVIGAVLNDVDVNYSRYYYGAKYSY